MIHHLVLAETEAAAEGFLPPAGGDGLAPLLNVSRGTMIVGGVEGGVDGEEAPSSSLVDGLTGLLHSTSLPASANTRLTSLLHSTSISASVNQAGSSSTTSSTDLPVGVATSTGPNLLLIISTSSDGHS